MGPKILAELIRSLVLLDLLLVIAIGAYATDDDNRQQHERYDDYNSCRDFALDCNRTLALQDIGYAVVFECHQRVSLRSTKATVAQ